jgi:ATPase subunit of ABC transporter with duplicated ATPase domains
MRSSVPLNRAKSLEAFGVNIHSRQRNSSRSGRGSTRRSVSTSPSVIDRSKQRVNESKLEPSRSRRLKKMEANTNGIAAIHAVRRNFQVEPSRKPNSIIGIGSPLS